MYRKLVENLLVVMVVTGSALAQAGAPPMAAATAAAVTTPDFRADLMKQVDVVGEKMVGLAEATPEEKYSWRPAEGVRSTGEVFLHMAIGNFVVASWAGSPVPADMDLRKLEKSNPGKEKTVAILKRSYQRLHEALAGTPDASLGKTINLFGKPSTLQNALLTMSMHSSEHLGQAIAYARSSGVVPPWSQKKDTDTKAPGKP